MRRCYDGFAAEVSQKDAGMSRSFFREKNMLDLRILPSLSTSFEFDRALLFNGG